MCGLVGILSSNLFMRHKECLSALLYLDTWRGKDSTGVAAVRQNADTVILKGTIPGYEFVEGPRLNEHLKLNDFLWIGHNRYGTVGRNIKTNSHPFEILDEDGACLLVGAHNGTLKNKYQLNDHQMFGTDSEALFNQIAFSSLEETITKVEGAWALTYYDHITEEFRVLRNKERPLFFAFEDDKKSIIWSSEAWMIRVACARAGIKLLDDKVLSFAEDTLYKFPAPMKINEEITYTKQGGLVGKTVGFFQGRTWKNGGWTGGAYDRQTGETQSQTTTETRSQSQTNPSHSSSSSSTAIAAATEEMFPQPQVTAETSTSQSGTKTSEDGEKLPLKKGSSSKTLSAEKPSKVVPIGKGKTYKGFNGEPLSRHELENRLENGCGWCELEFITPEDRFAWLDQDKPICAKCLNGIVEEKEVNPKVKASKTVH